MTTYFYQYRCPKCNKVYPGIPPMQNLKKEENMSDDDFDVKSYVEWMKCPDCKIPYIQELLGTGKKKDLKE